jgi:hypothetical protein
VGTTACFDIDVLNVDDSDCVAGNDTSLIQVETELLLSSFLVFEVFGDWMSLQNDLVSFIFDLHFCLFTDGFIVSDINVSIVFSLLSTVLPDMWTENSSCGSINNVSTGVEADESVSSFFINFSNNFLTDNSFKVDFSVKIMQEASTNFFNVVDLISLLTNDNGSKIVNLTS